ncbi:hypothetical protein [Dyadobacter tibetensis]|uniref:hypothetical protein n=1 Tax=Dyadobacter tibetensis TaxID=1211851 RepID=UPI0004721CE8|nr:hypothetical protein [Dyadobacter tibetensis]
MDIESTLLSQHQQSKPVAIAVAQYAVGDEAHFAELMSCFLSPDYRLCQRAAYSLGFACQFAPTLIIPYLSQMIKQLERSDNPPSAIVRNTVKIFAEIDIPDHLHGSLMTHCFQYICSGEAPKAVKAYSLTILHKLSKLYPDIRSELELTIRERMDFESAAFRSRGKRILQWLVKNRNP